MRSAISTLPSPRLATMAPAPSSSLDEELDDEPLSLSLSLSLELELDSPRISLRMSAYRRSFSSNSGSSLNTSKPGCACISSSKPISCTIWSSSSTKSSSGGTPFFPSNPPFRNANNPSIINCTRLSISPSCKIPLNRSKMPCKPCGVSSWSVKPHSLTKSIATSTLSSVGVPSNTVNSSSAINS